jgi:HAE1 family hydrophobic/amphiphilic exporter-1
MSISDLFIRRPVATVLLMFSILLVGVIGYRLLPVSDLPNVDFPTLSVSASLPGASPETMASAVATVLEKEFTTIAGVDSMSSTSSLGQTRITLQFALTRNIDAAAQDVQAAIARAQRRLPSGMPSPPSYRKSNPADQPILFIALSSPTVPLSALDQYGQTMSQRISMVEGVAQVQLRGSQKYAVRIRLDPVAMNARGLGVDEIAAAVEAQNVNQPLGTLSGPYRSVTLLANGQLTVASQYRPLVVAVRNGQPVRLEDVATVIDSVQNDKDAAWYITPTSKARSIFLQVMKQPGSNTVKVADAVRAVLPSFQERLPTAVSMQILRDSSEPIRASAEDVQFTLLLTLALVVLVIFMFIRNVSATVIPSLALPMSLAGTFAVMYLLDYSLDNLSLMALTLSVGFVVDDAIVMLENIVRHLEMGKTRLQAALDGAREVGFTIISMTLSLAAVFIPLLFMGGMMGRLFTEFAVTIGVAVLVSGVVSLTLTPMLCSRFLREQRLVHHGAVYRATEAGYQVLARFYGWSLLKVLRYKFLTLLVSVAVLWGTADLYKRVPKGFIPSEDRDLINVGTEAAQDISWGSLVEHVMALAEIVRQDPNVDRFMVDVGTGGSMNIMLKPRRERQLSADQVIDELRPKLNRVPGIRAMLVNPPPIRVGGRQSRSLYQLTLQSTDIEQLYVYADKLEQQMRKLDYLQDVSSDMQLKNPQLNVDIDRDQAILLGVTPQQIEDTLYSAYGPRTVSTIFAPNDQYDVIMEVLPEYQTDPSMLSMLHIRSAAGKLVPLSAVTRQREDVGPLSINHAGQLPAVTVSFNLRRDIALGQALDRLTTLTRAEMPRGMTAGFQGSAQQFQASQASMGWLLVLAIVVIYVVLGILYESFIHPLTILTALPFAGFGALLTLYVFGAELSVYAFVGVIMLVGLVKKNGIMMIDFAIDAQRREGKNAHDAIHEACVIRFRPIMMTTMAALMAGLPIALGYGAGAESRRPLGLAVVGGLLFSQSLTLYVTPVFYLYMERLQAWLRRKPAQSHPTATVESPSSPSIQT